MSRRDQLSLDRVAINTARRQCKELWRAAYPNAIEPIKIGLAAWAFEDAARKAVVDLNIEGDHAAILHRLGELWVQTFDATLNRLKREDRP